MSTGALEVMDGDPISEAVVCDLENVSCRQVRQLVRGLLDGRPGDVVDDVVIVVDELVSNAIRHGRSPRRCRLAVTDEGRCLRVEVDDGADDQPRIRTPDRTGGRGLILVDRLAAAWGVRQHPRHKTVWAHLDLDGQDD